MQPHTTPPPEQPSEGGLPNGWRYIPRKRPDGTTELEQVPLTLEDVLHPQEDDEIPVRPEHSTDCIYLREVFSSRPLGPDIVYVSFDHLVDWGVPGQRDTSPDVAVFVGLREKPKMAGGSLDIKGLGGRCLLVVEVVSPERRMNDIYHKFAEYFDAGVPLYVLIDQEKEAGPRSVRGFQRRSTGYEELVSDPLGLFLPPLNLFLALRDELAVCFDADTGKELGDYVRVVQEANRLTRDLEAADRRIVEQGQALEHSVLAERQQRVAREDAERLARERKEALEGAELRERQQKEAREAAETLARQQKEALETAEARIRELAAALSRLQGASPP